MQAALFDRSGHFFIYVAHRVLRPSASLYLRAYRGIIEKPILQRQATANKAPYKRECNLSVDIDRREYSETRPIL